MADPNARLPALLAEVRAAGFRVNNLFHRADGQCQANLRSAAESPICFEWAYGHTFADALEAALAKARGGKSVTPRIPVGVTALPDGGGVVQERLDAGLDEAGLIPSTKGAFRVDPAQIDLEEAIAATPAPADVGPHYHCQGDDQTSCKYGDSDCPVWPESEAAPAPADDVDDILG